MANPILPFLYGTNPMEQLKGVSGISLQFHITAKCDQSCKHCYMYNSPYYKAQIDNELTENEMKNLLDEYFEFLGEYNCDGSIALTGGDPILSPYFWNLLTYINNNYSKRCVVVILGNPYHIDRKIAKRLKKLGIGDYQISLDGLKKTHDKLRKVGSFENSLRAMKVLHEEGIRTIVSFTLSKINKSELIPLFEFLEKCEFVDGFGFDIMIPTGNGESMKEEIFEPEEYKAFLFELYKYEIFGNHKLEISKKAQMWKVLFWELGLTDPIDTRKKQHYISGCGAGTETLSVLADGTIFPCRKMELSAGKYPEKSFKEILLHNEVTKKLMKYNNYKGCSNCEVNTVCRGCPAMKYALTGNIYEKEPCCWRCQ